ncbi:MAG: helix-turn-helix domain-containing protein [Anaerolineales bacterium]|jgi:DNA-binding XRE family transcriptional regulator
METFIIWLDKQAEKHKWTRSKLAKRAGVSPTAIYMIARGKREPGSFLCNGLAKALNLTREEVYRAAGLLPSKPQPNEDVERGEHYLDLMKPGTRKQAVAYLESLLSKENTDKNTKQA